jgi:hypothetical protein
MGYPKKTIGYYFYHPNRKMIFVSKHATFIKRYNLFLKGVVG